ncbi:MAG: hypothetical protein MUO57_07105, partial [Anaerolineales bacterium]|nr:hypothetical protein [Anaerolineales bacterium]
MKKRIIYVYKTWPVFIVLLLGGFSLTFSSGLAADSNLEQYETGNWTSSGYREVTVGDSQVYE